MQRRALFLFVIFLVFFLTLTIVGPGWWFEYVVVEPNITQLEGRTLVDRMIIWISSRQVRITNICLACLDPAGLSPYISRSKKEFKCMEKQKDK